MLKAAVLKRQGPPRAKMAIRLTCLTELVESALSAGEVAEAILYLTSYAFLLRVPSEGLRLAAGDVGAERGESSGVMTAGDDATTLQLFKRKTKPHGSLLTRRCWCSSASAVCPVHVLGAWAQQLAAGSQPFAQWRPSRATEMLRRRLRDIGVESHESYTLHAFRRGHAQDLVASGSSAAEILRAGEWRSCAFLQYLDVDSLECQAVVEAHLAESSDSGDEPL